MRADPTTWSLHRLHVGADPCRERVQALCLHPDRLTTRLGLHNRHVDLHADLHTRPDVSTPATPRRHPCCSPGRRECGASPQSPRARIGRRPAASSRERGSGRTPGSRRGRRRGGRRETHVATGHDRGSDAESRHACDPRPWWGAGSTDNHRSSHGTTPALGPTPGSPHRDRPGWSTVDLPCVMPVGDPSVRSAEGGRRWTCGLVSCRPAPSVPAPICNRRRAPASGAPEPGKEET